MAFRDHSGCDNHPPPSYGFLNFSSLADSHNTPSHPSPRDYLQQGMGPSSTNMQSYAPQFNTCPPQHQPEIVAGNENDFVQPSTALPQSDAILFPPFDNDADFSPLSNEEFRKYSLQDLQQQGHSAHYQPFIHETRASPERPRELGVLANSNNMQVQLPSPNTSYPPNFVYAAGDIQEDLLANHFPNQPTHRTQMRNTLEENISDSLGTTEVDRTRRDSACKVNRYSALPPKLIALMVEELRNAPPHPTPPSATAKSSKARNMHTLDHHARLTDEQKLMTAQQLLDSLTPKQICGEPLLHIAKSVSTGDITKGMNNKLKALGKTETESKNISHRIKSAFEALYPDPAQEEAARQALYAEQKLNGVASTRIGGDKGYTKAQMKEVTKTRLQTMKKNKAKRNSSTTVENDQAEDTDQNEVTTGAAGETMPPRTTRKRSAAAAGMYNINIAEVVATALRPKKLPQTQKTTTKRVRLSNFPREESPDTEEGAKLHVGE